MSNPRSTTNQFELAQKELDSLSFDRPMSVATAINKMELVQEEPSEQPAKVKASPSQILRFTHQRFYEVARTRRTRKEVEYSEFDAATYNSVMFLERS